MYRCALYILQWLFFQRSFTMQLYFVKPLDCCIFDKLHIEAEGDSVVSTAV